MFLITSSGEFNQVICRLTLLWRNPLSYRNQSTDLLRKSMDCFLYDTDLRHERVKKKMYAVLLQLT